MDRKRQLEDLRADMAKIDMQLVALLDKRASVARRVGDLRKDVPSLPTGAEGQLAALLSHGSGDMPPAALREIFREIFASSLSLEMPATVAVVGQEGGTGHAAARMRLGVAARVVALDSVHAAFEEVQRQRADFAVVPFETRADGLVQSTISALIASELRVISCFEVAHNLQLASRTANFADVEKVYATAADHALVERFLEAELPKASVIDVRSPMVACQLAVEDHGAAAIGDESFAGQFELHVARRNIRDGGDERIRYAICGARPSSRTGDDVTAIAFSVADAPGALHQVLQRFAEKGINLTKIQSRPTPTEAWKYLFFIEVAGHVTDRNVVSALEEVKRQAKFFKVLGSYEAS